MPWAQLDDQFHAHPKTLVAGLAGSGLFARALSYCADYLTDGLVPAAWVWAQITQEDDPQVIERVTEAGLWKPVKGGFRIPDYLEYNPSKADVLKARAQRAERQQRWRKRQKGDATVDAPVDDLVDAPVDALRERYEGVSSRGRAAPAPAPTPEEKGTTTAAGETTTPAAADDELEQALTTLGWGPTERDAARAEPTRAWAWVHRAQAHADANPGGYAWKGFESGAWPPDENSRPRRRLPTLEQVIAWVERVGVQLERPGFDEDLTEFAKGEAHLIASGTERWQQLRGFDEGKYAKGAA